jgi:PIN domain nuclease of toxin-antitoxin system
MKSHITDGATSELQVAAILLEHEWAVAFPFTHQNPFDLIIYKAGKSRTVQSEKRNVCRQPAHGN